MKFLRDFVGTAVVGGLLVLVPLYLAVLLIGKLMETVVGVVKPIANLLPAWVPGERILSLLLVLLLCFVVGLLVRTSRGLAVRDQLDRSLFGKLPGYDLFRSLSLRAAGRSEQAGWKPAIAEVEDAYVPAFIIETLDNGSYTVFVPSVPTPFAGALYVLTPDRVHELDVPLAQAARAISQWGVGVKDLVEKMKLPDAVKPRDAA
ncbi:MAG TPA: hypothetical protein VMV37_03945 [Gammaproteobacteria bacterium]|nr:hypothetical protein [Gammaproteobacteria bacterium]